ncbi:hypothetical protein KC717_05860, partial [Candidatus Dojkabacteria bacterium]|nr:hypothetical protein [Candidatus Dojkabacteria bacterium]
MNTLKRNLYRLFVGGVVMAPFLFLSGIAHGQSQNDINPAFDASSENMFYVNVNYDCSNVKIPPT